MNHERIIEILRSEALDDRETGWLSDMGLLNLSYDDDNWAIIVGQHSGSIDLSHLASIDLSHLASIVLGILEGERA